MGTHEPGIPGHTHTSTGMAARVHSSEAFLSEQTNRPCSLFTAALPDVLEEIWLERVGCFPGTHRSSTVGPSLPASPDLSPPSGPTRLGCQANHSCCAWVGGQADSGRGDKGGISAHGQGWTSHRARKDWLFLLLSKLLCVEPIVSGWNLNIFIYSFINSPGHSIKYPHKTQR